MTENISRVEKKLDGMVRNLTKTAAKHGYATVAALGCDENYGVHALEGREGLIMEMLDNLLSSFLTSSGMTKGEKKETAQMLIDTIRESIKGKSNE